MCTGSLFYLITIVRSFLLYIWVISGVGYIKVTDVWAGQPATDSRQVQ